MKHDHKSRAKLQWCSSKKWVEHWQTTSNNHHNSSPRNSPNFSVAEIPIANALQQVSQSALEPRYLLQGAKRLMVTCSRIYVGDHLVHIRDKTVNMFVSWQTYLLSWVRQSTNHLNGWPSAKNRVNVWELRPNASILFYPASDLKV